MEKHLKSNRGRTGYEGNSVKAFGVLALVAGLVWLMIAWLMSDGGYALAWPVTLAVAGVVAFMVGSSMARPLPDPK